MINEINWQKVNGLVPCIVQDSQDLSVLMLAYMNEKALQKTISTGEACFYSRTRQSLWTKGESSGNKLIVDSIELDCDQDTLLIKASPLGPTCHKGVKTCFDELQASPRSFLPVLERKIDQRFNEKPEGSYISSLLKKGSHKIAQKVGEEAVEMALASKDNDQAEFLEESADLLFHYLLLLRQKGCDLDQVLEVLQARDK